MHTINYPIEPSQSHLIFDFFSSGPNGRIKKRVVFELISVEGDLYNLGFGDITEDGGINDKITTNNMDSQRVLTTVALTLFKFFDKHPNASVFAIGSTKSRTGLYQIGISNNLDLALQDFEIYGLLSDRWEIFKKGISYEAFFS